MNKMKKILLYLLAVSMMIGTFGTVAASASGQKQTEITFEDMWKDTYYPAYMATQFSTIKDRMLGMAGIDPMKLMCVIDGVAFYADTITGEMVFLTLTDPELTKEDIEESGSIPEYTAYYSTNPYNAGYKGGDASKNVSESVKEQLYSQLIIRYTMNNSDMEMNSFKDAASNNQITVKNIRGGVRAEYSIGREQVVYLVPRMIRYEKFQALLEQVRNNSSSSRDWQTLNAFYVLYDLNDKTKAQKTLDGYKKEFPILEKFAIYACEKRIATKELLRVENIIKLYTDYTYEQMEADHQETEYTSTDSNPPLFKMAIEYKVDGKGGILIRLNAGNIRFDSGTYKLSNVVLLPYGGAGNASNEGYIFTPDGSGSLIAFKDVLGQSSFTNANAVYGPDFAYHTITGQNREIMRFPTFGVIEWAKNGSHEEEQPVLDDNGDIIYRTDSEGNDLLDDDGRKVPMTQKVVVEDLLKIGYLAIIESGDSLARINVTNGGSLHNFISVYTTFNPRPKDTYALSGGTTNDANATWTVESKRKYTGDYKIRLFMLSEDVTYSEMAKLYRNFLISNGSLKPLENDGEDIPLYLETLGALEVSDTVLGIPIRKMVALTSFEDDIRVLKEIGDKGIKNVNLKLTGFCNGGMFMTASNQVSIERVLGNDAGFQSLVDFVNADGSAATLFPDFDLNYVYSSKLFDGFSARRDLTRTIDNRSSALRQYDSNIQAYRSLGAGVVSPNVMATYYEKLYKDYEKFNVGTISVGTMGSSLNSDFNKEDPLTREDAKILAQRLMDTIRSQNERVMVSGGNAYVLPYVTDIIEVPLEDSSYQYSCASVPFMAMVLHGYKNFSGPALNIAGDYQKTILRSVESGCSPYFIIACNDTSELKEYASTLLDKYYSVRYTIWKDSMVQAYNILNTVLKSVKYETLEQHEFLDYDYRVVKVTYSNGESFYINYLQKDYAIRLNGQIVQIPAGGFIKTDKDGKILFTYDEVLRESK